jgi:adenylate kinase
VLKRLNVYHEQTQPLIEYYKGKNILRTVDGTRDPETAFADIIKIVESK